MNNFLRYSTRTVTTTRAKGFSLVEFMVAMTISLAVVAAASVVYLNANQAQRVLTERQNLFEGARVTMDIIGRDLENAGYFPSEAMLNLLPTIKPDNGDSKPVFGYSQPCENPFFPLTASPTAADYAKSMCDFAPPAAFAAPVFGCSGQRLLRTGTGANVAYACSALPSGIPTADSVEVDSLVVNYFTVDAGSLQLGQRGDCEGQDVAKDSINSRNLDTPSGSKNSPSKPNRLSYLNDNLAATDPLVVQSPALGNLALLPASYSPTTSWTQLVPRLPLFVSNRYTLVPSVETVQKQSINSRSLACDGNGNDNDDNSSLASNAQPIVSGLRQLKFHYFQDDDAGNGQYLASGAVTDWNAVKAVRVCLLAESIQTVPNVQEPVVDCNGASRTFGDGRARKVFTQVFALKNQLGAELQ